MFVDSRATFSRADRYQARRREPRYVHSVPVTLQRFLRFGPAVTHGVCLDISMRGMSALVCGAPRVGETVVVGALWQDNPIEILSTVRHSSNAKSGFEFYPLSPIAQQWIEDWIRESRKDEETLFSYPYMFAAKYGRN